VIGLNQPLNMVKAAARAAMAVGGVAGGGGSVMTSTSSKSTRRSSMYHNVTAPSVDIPAVTESTQSKIRLSFAVDCVVAFSSDDLDIQGQSYDVIVT